RHDEPAPTGRALAYLHAGSGPLRMRPFMLLELLLRGDPTAPLGTSPLGAGGGPEAASDGAARGARARGAPNLLRSRWRPARAGLGPRRVARRRHHGPALRR